jgi:hypothetical protein
VVRQALAAVAAAAALHASDPLLTRERSQIDAVWTTSMQKHFLSPLLHFLLLLRHYLLLLALLVRLPLVLLWKIVCPCHCHCLHPFQVPNAS